MFVELLAWCLGGVCVSGITGEWFPQSSEILEETQRIKGLGWFYRGEASWLAGGKDRGPDPRELSWAWEEGQELMRAILSFSHSSNTSVSLLCDEFPGKVLHL